MKKSLVSIIFSSVLIFGLSGCGGGQPGPSSSSNVSGNLIVEVNADSEIVKKALLRLVSSSSHKTTIRNNGGKHIYSSDGNCIKMQYFNLNENLYTKKNCYNVRRNASKSEITGLSFFSGNSLISSTDFTEDFDSYIKTTNNIIKSNIATQIVKSNTLSRLSELKEIAKSKQFELQKMYETYFHKYKKGLSHIKLVYTTQDKSKLFNISDKKLDVDYHVVLNAPNKKDYNYNSILNSFSSASSNFDNKYTDAVNKINLQFEENKKEYKAYLETSFTNANYKIEGPKEKTFKYNEHISFESTIKAPLEVKYKLHNYVKVPITIIIESATLTNMIPKQFSLNDSNMNINFELNTNATVSVIAENKTKSFVTTKSLTSYYKSDVYSMSDIDREISPEAITVSGNSNYSLLSDKMIDSSNFKGITKAKAKSIKINYGYAVKYRLNNTNLNKSIYDTKKYSLYSIFKQYL